MNLDGYYLVPLSINLDGGQPVVSYDPLSNGEQPQLKIDLQDNPADSFDQLQYRISIDPRAKLSAIEWSFNLASGEADLSEVLALYRVEKGQLVPVEGLSIGTQRTAVEGITSLELNFAVARKGAPLDKAIELKDRFLTLTPIADTQASSGLGDPQDITFPPGGIIRI
ncbi:hypothetical protein [Ferrimonas balearica]|uniref:hypothetical protein n=1 Tax=Ferrimonas balearica TaxID=44012 RepID=UPI001F2F6F81|nr:hypothetical protein [Ferrimonas balearica]MBY6095208.1 hypothetical protein [Ferrimonas balearica]